MSFVDLGLHEKILRAISDQGYTEPTPIQNQAIPLILQGRDLMGGAQTGTGKTAGFTLPLLHRLQSLPKGKSRPVRALILTPTRELAAQVAQSVKTYGKHLDLRSAVIFGGVSMQAQKATLRKGVDILIATPGRLLDHLGQKTVNLSQLEMLVLDEADRMLDMGFIHDIRRLLHFLPPKRQTLLFSATFSKEIKKLSTDLLRDPALIEVTPSNASADTITQLIHPVDRKKKGALLVHLIQTGQWEQALVFTRTKHGANRLTQQLEDEGIRAAAIHGNKTQNARMQALSRFKQGKVRVLVATDIAARGLDITQLPLVVNFELPCVPEDYVHRIGRTGRAGNEGIALSLVCIDEKKLLLEIEKLIRKELPKKTLSGFEPDPSIKAEPILRGRGGGSGKRPSMRQGRSPGKPGAKRTDKRRPAAKQKQKSPRWGRAQRRKAGV